MDTTVALNAVGGDFIASKSFTARFDMFRILTLISIVLCLLLSHVAAQEIPFKVEKGYLLIGGQVKQDFPFEAAVATGSTYSFYNGASLKKMRLSESTSNDMLNSGINHESAITLVYVPQLALADQKPTEMKMQPRTKAFDAMSQALGRNIDFVLGADYFEGRIVQFDFKSRVMRFLDKPTVDYKMASSSSASGPIRLIFKMTGHIQNIFGTMITLPVADEVTLNGNKVPSLLNTGVVMPVTVGPYVSKRLMTGKESSGRTTISKVALGDYEMTDVPAMLSEIKDDNDKLYSAVIGLGVLQNFIITFDWKNKWIVLEK